MRTLLAEDSFHYSEFALQEIIVTKRRNGTELMGWILR